MSSLRQKGLSLIEVMITLVVFSFGVLALAALGVWTLLRRSRRTALGADDNGDDVYPHIKGLANGAIDYSRVDVGEPTGGSDPQNQPLSRMAKRSPVT